MTLHDFLQLPDPPKGVQRIFDTASIRGYREVCDMKSAPGRREYRKRTLDAWKRDKGNCGICGLLVSPWPGSLTAEHPNGRGMGGSRRDDHPDEIVPAHALCNGEKGSVRATQVTRAVARHA